jgi:hypothetical protein
MDRWAERGARGWPSDFGETLQIGREHVALENEVRELPLADDLDEAGGLQLLHVMGDGRGAHLLRLGQAATGGRIGRAADVTEHLVAARFSKGAGDQRELSVCDAGGGGAAHGSPYRGSMPG